MPKKKVDDLDFFVKKCPLSKIIKRGKKRKVEEQARVTLETIEDAVVRTNKIVINTYQFIKLYLIHLFELDQPFPIIDKHFVMTCMSIVSHCKKTKTPKSETLKLKEVLTEFFHDHFEQWNGVRINAELLTKVLDPEAGKMITNIENLIKSQYFNRVRQFINFEFNVKETIQNIEKNSGKTAEEKKLEKSNLYSEVKNYKFDVFNVTNKPKESDVKHHKDIDELKLLIVPKKDKFVKDNLLYDLKSNPMDYLRCLIALNQLFEHGGYKGFHAFPLRSDIKPKYITIETAALIDLLVPARTKINGKLKTQMKSNVNQSKDIWFYFFETRHGAFKKKGYSFHSQIQTDGVGVSIIFSKPKVKTPKIPKSEEEPEFYYLEDVNVPQNKKIVGIDPGKSDIIYCIDENRETFRYTANQRRFETGAKKYRKYMYENKKRQVINGKTVIEHETQLGKTGSKTCDLEKFQEYIMNKTDVNDQLFEYYRLSKTRKFKLNRYFNTERSESNMVNNFKKKYGSPDQTIIAFGDHTQGQRQMRGLEPTKDIGMRRLLRKHGYGVYLVNEFRTSKLCHKCKCDTEKFQHEFSKKPKTFGMSLLVHGLIRCKNGKCGIKWNRDYNASLNILEIAWSLVEGKGRPREFCRNSGPVLG